MYKNKFISKNISHKSSTVTKKRYLSDEFFSKSSTISINLCRILLF